MQILCGRLDTWSNIYLETPPLTWHNIPWVWSYHHNQKLIIRAGLLYQKTLRLFYLLPSNLFQESNCRFWITENRQHFRHQEFHARTIGNSVQRASVSSTSLQVRHGGLPKIKLETTRIFRVCRRRKSSCGWLVNHTNHPELAEKNLMPNMAVWLRKA